ncbi:hypothetical protein GW17_00007662 [Ensete ventricosum]|nr:hypothetical protein GW17_00007662 [Ensete ventricosum]
MLCPSVTQEWVDECQLPRERTNRKWRRPYDVLAEATHGEVVGRGSDNDSSGAQLPKSKASVRKEVDSEERHSAAEADLPIAKEGMKMQGNG